MVSSRKHRQVLLDRALSFSIFLDKNQKTPTTIIRSRVEAFNIAEYLWENPQHEHVDHVSRVSSYYRLVFYLVSSRFHLEKKYISCKDKIINIKVFFQISKMLINAILDNNIKLSYYCKFLELAPFYCLLWSNLLSDEVILFIFTMCLLCEDHLVQI